MQTKQQAIETYLKAQTGVHGLGSVILLPEFEGDDDNGWTPVESNGIRSTTKGEQSFIRLGSVSLGDGFKTQVRYTNSFLATEQLVATMDMIGAKPGSKLPGKLVIHERMMPFSKSTPTNDIKWADKAAGIMCTFQGTKDGITYDEPAIIYRRTEHKMDSNAQDILIQHTNGAAISAHASTKFQANSNALKNAARRKELESIPVAKRTKAQVAELSAL